ncbi:hypothetical protein JL720_9149 [Aureococcus anophagefferens]|nr:hypothetical protein JL720_9149 [Aureococcus anophagefferens]
MRSVGAVLESSQWFGWAPAQDRCPAGDAGGLNGSVVRVTNVTPPRRAARRAATTSAAAPPPPTKFIVVTGGVISGIGKGVTASSIGVCMKMLGARVTAVKIDPYLNVDAGTMSPLEHGECFVLDDGGETDLDLGNYERFLDVLLGSDSNLTTGKIYKKVIERGGAATTWEDGADHPHVTDEIMARVESVARAPVDGSGAPPDICIVELGGTIGDIESMPFVEALRQLQLRHGPSGFCLVHVSMVPTTGPPPGEQKTKPTQHSVKELRSLGLTPDFIVCRSKHEVGLATRDKIGLFCNVPTERVLSLYDLPNIYRVPLEMLDRNLDILISEQLRLTSYRSSGAVFEGRSDGGVSLQRDAAFGESWKAMATRMESSDREVVVALVGKYHAQADSYLSVQSSLKHACVASDRKLRIEFVDSEKLEDGDAASWRAVKAAGGVLVPGGFGDRGTEGKIDVIKYAREHGTPFLGICLGMQLAVVEFARNVLDIANATSSEFDGRTTFLAADSLASRVYGGAREVDERHRHRYEVNPDLVAELEDGGLRFSGKDDTGRRAEVVELDGDHPFFFGCQFHPEYKSRPLSPSPPFLAFVRAAAALDPCP